jgi:hypothetical protein
VRGGGVWEEVGGAWGGRAWTREEGLTEGGEGDEPNLSLLHFANPNRVRITTTRKPRHLHAHLAHPHLPSISFPPPAPSPTPTDPQSFILAPPPTPPAANPHH